MCVVSNLRRGVISAAVCMGLQAAMMVPATAADPDVAIAQTPGVQVIPAAAPAKKIYSLSKVMNGELPPKAIAAAGGGRRGLNGRLVGILNRIERSFGRPVIITSGCRSSKTNRRAGGARGSYHLRCMAADIRVAGVPEGRLLRFARNLPGVGGIGTYCGNSIVHIDVGPRRAWSGGCGRKKKRRRG